MVTIVDKRERAAQFRERLMRAMESAESNQSALARDCGVDRSTISQLLKDEGARMPNAQLVAGCAASLGVSSDWLLGLSDRPEQAAALVASAMTMKRAPRALIDEAIFNWHQEAQGYKIRHVPTALPDMLKTDEMLGWEYGPSLGKTAEQAIGASRDRLNWMRKARSDYEIAMPLHELESFARAEGYYHGLPGDIRLRQLNHLEALCEQLYPSLRVYMYDSRRLYSSPITVFGPLLAVIYLGSSYLAFRDAERVQAITKHFDSLVREAEIPSRDFPAELDRLKRELR